MIKFIARFGAEFHLQIWCDKSQKLHLSISHVFGKIRMYLLMNIFNCSIFHRELYRWKFLSMINSKNIPTTCSYPTVQDIWGNFFHNTMHKPKKIWFRKKSIVESTGHENQAKYKYRSKFNHSLDIGEFLPWRHAQRSKKSEKIPSEVTVSFRSR